MARSTRPPSAEPLRGGTTEPLRGGTTEPLRGGVAEPLRGGTAEPPGRGREPFLWVAGTGDAAFAGAPGWNMVWLDGLTLPEVLAGIAFEEPGLVLRPAGNGTLFVEDAAGWPALGSGRLVARGGTLRFRGLLCLGFLV